jgi:hypothetical protein
MLETDFLAPLQLHYPPIVDHQLDRPMRMERSASSSSRRSAGGRGIELSRPAFGIGTVG